MQCITTQFYKLLECQWINRGDPQRETVVANCGYHTSKYKPAILTITPNLHDPVEIQKFKSGTKHAIHPSIAESKTFDACQNVFVIVLTNHKIVFEAVCIICQHPQLEN